MRDTFPAGWPDGVIGATDATMLAATASPRGLNSTLTQAMGGRPLAAKRKGLACVNATPLAGSTPVIGQTHYYNIATATDYHLLVSRGGRLDSRSSGDTITTRSTALTAGDHYPDFAIANNLAFIVNGQDRLKFDGTSVTNFGITRPTVGAMAGAAGAAGLHSGTYELRVSYYNSTTGHESSASDTATTTVTVTNQVISWSALPVSSDTQVTHRYLYARNIATQTQWFRVGTVADNVATTASTSILDANATTAAPSTTARSRPASGTKYLAFHQGRMFAATDTALQWSKVDFPEAFDDTATDGINASGGERITGLVSTKEILLIFKERRLYGLFNGNDPNSWQIRLIDDDYGCASHRTIVTVDGVTYWWSAHGLCGWDGGQIVNYSDRFQAPLVDTFAVGSFAMASAAKDDTNNRLLIALPSLGSSTANYLVPFHTGLQRFEATYWDPMDAASLGTSYDSSGQSRIYLGNYTGQVFVTDTGHVDGVSSGTHTGTWVATEVAMTTFTSLLTSAGAAAALDITGGGVIGRRFQLFTSAGALVSVRRNVTANTATGVTLSAAMDGLTIGTTYVWTLGGIDFQWDTPWIGEWTTKKRYEFLYTLFKGVGYGAATRIDLTFDWNELGDARQRTLETSAQDSEWDASLWDVAVWDGRENLRDRFRVARTGYVWRARIRNSDVNSPVGVVSLVVSGVTQGGKT